MNRPTLEGLAKKYSSDKYYSHSYIPWYERELAQYRDRQIRLLEIGIGYRDLMEPFVPNFIQASSILMWREYFPYADIFACDIRPEVMVEGYKIQTFVIDQSKPVDLWKLMKWGPFDIIIDDGSHVTEHQILTASTLVPELWDGGIYIIEDVKDPYILTGKLGGEVWKFNKRPDDCLVVVRR